MKLKVHLYVRGDIICKGLFGATDISNLHPFTPSKDCDTSEAVIIFGDLNVTDMSVMHCHIACSGTITALGEI